jgi:hypothetical protein
MTELLRSHSDGGDSHAYFYPRHRVARLLESLPLIRPRGRKGSNMELRKPELLPRLTRNRRNSRINESAATNRGPTTVRWVTTGGCIAATATVWAAMTVRRVQTGGCFATVRWAAIATWIVDDTESGGTETGTTRTEIGTGYIDEDRPRHRVKVCVEYANGDEYCRYKE